MLATVYFETAKTFEPISEIGKGKKVDNATWSSSDKKVATVKAGKVTAVKAGTCTITAQVNNGKKLTCKVTVKDNAKLSRTRLTVRAGHSHALRLSLGEAYSPLAQDCIQPDVCYDMVDTGCLRRAENLLVRRAVREHGQVVPEGSGK